MKKKEKGERVEKIRNVKPRKMMIIVLWLMLGFICFRGVVGIFSQGDIKEQREDLQQYMAELSTEENLKTQALGFAENFVRDFYTFSGKQDQDNDYAYRIGQYVAAGLTIDVPMNTSAKAIEVNAVKLEISDDLVDVTVTAIVEFPEIQRKTLTILVPLIVDEGKFAVISMPQLIPEIVKAEVDHYTASLPGSEVSNSELPELREVINSFLKVYYEGNENELSYFISETFPYQHGLEGEVEFVDTSMVRASFDAEKGTYYAIVNYTVNDGGRNLQQIVYLTMLQKDGRFYISNISTRF